MPKKTSKTKTANQQKYPNEKPVAILSYLLIGIIWYFVDESVKKSDFAKFHVKQGIVLIASYIILGILYEILFLGVLRVIISILYLLLFVLFIIGIVYAASDKKKELPIIGQFAKHLKF